MGWPPCCDFPNDPTSYREIHEHGIDNSRFRRPIRAHMFSYETLQRISSVNFAGLEVLMVVYSGPSLFAGSYVALSQIHLVLVCYCWNMTLSQCVIISRRFEVSLFHSRTYWPLTTKTSACLEESKSFTRRRNFEPHVNGFISTPLRQHQHSKFACEFNERIKNIGPRSCDEAELARRLKHSLALQDWRTANCWSLLYTIYSVPRRSPLSGSKVFLRNMQVTVRICRPWMKQTVWVKDKRQDRKSERFQALFSGEVEGNGRKIKGKNCRSLWRRIRQVFPIIWRR
jgi:hypothetical protein